MDAILFSVVKTFTLHSNLPMIESISIKYTSKEMIWFFLVISLSLSTARPKSPHLVFIVADDLGWNDLGYHNPDIISPNIDSLAGGGITLNQSYVQPLCSP
ncbi:unnamed protein product [Lymnaea stagnalis]|uniref:Sulfatase N-terminal domain-containing protein n=1 Tax=Lymnaea stagnalis TaxID=6523 RepID=A0AAV2HZE6_LYMST